MLGPAANMPVRWTFDHSRRSADIVIEGTTEPKDLVGLLDAFEAEGAVGYRKLLDATRVVPTVIDGRNMAPIAARVAAFQNPGPVAVVVPASGPVDGITRLFVLLSEAEGRIRVFRNVDEGRAWLDSLVGKT